MWVPFKFIQCFIVVVILESDVQGSCPIVCVCTTVSLGLNVDCNSKALRTLPDGIPVETVHLFLYENIIEDITDDSFSHLVTLKELYIYRNRVKELHAKTFWKLYNLQILHVAENNISSLEPELFRDSINLRVLHFQQNNISFIPKRVFENTTALQIIYLYGNRIEDLEPTTFSGLNSLRELYLQNNQLQRFDANTFSGLLSLEKLDVSQNHIRLIETFSFNNLSALTILYLYTNALRVVMAYSFSDLPSLEQIDLYDNQISVIESNAFNNIPSIYKLQLHLNEITCNCSIQWFHGWLLSNPSIGTAEATCLSTGSYIIDITIDYFKDCNKYVIDSPTSINCGLYSNVEIPCTLIGQPGTFRAWYHYRKSLIVRTLAGTMSDDTNTLALKSCRAEDAGDYVCVWNISKPFSITVNGSTSMTVNVDLEMTKSSFCNTTFPISYSCNLTSTTLSPDGWIHTFNGVFIRKLPGNTFNNVSVLQIPSCNSQDAGRYRFKWRGDALGLNISNYLSDLEVNGPPIITSKTIDISGTSRKLSILFVSAPSYTDIQWKFDNQSLSFDSKYHISTTTTSITTQLYGVNVQRAGFLTMLMIHNFASTNAAGNYYCIIINNHGYANETFKPSPGMSLDDNSETSVWIIVIICVIVLIILVVLCTVCLACKKGWGNGNNENRNSFDRHSHTTQPDLYDTPVEYETIPRTLPSLPTNENTAVKTINDQPNRSSLANREDNVVKYFPTEWAGYISVDNITRQPTIDSYEGTVSSTNYEESESAGYFCTTSLQGIRAKSIATVNRNDEDNNSEVVQIMETNN